MSTTHEAAVACVDHPELPTTRTCMICGRGYCDYCGDPPLVQRRKTAKPAIICRHCSGKARPWVWNPYAYGRDEEPGEHLTQALWAPRTAMLRAGYGRIPAGALALLIWLGCLGMAWIGVELRVAGDPDVVAFARFGYGIAWSWIVALAFAAFAISLHAVQPGGPGRPATAAQSLQVAATAFAWPGAAAFCAGLTGFVASTLWTSELPLLACGAGCLLATGWGAAMAGWGLAVRRGSKPLMGIVSAAAAAVALAVMAALVVWILVNPPWQTGWENTAF